MNFKNLTFLVKILFSVTLIWYASSRIDLSDSFAQIKNISLKWGLTAIVLFYIQLSISALRYKFWFGILQSPVSYMQCLNATLVGYFFGQTFISFIGGDAMRTLRMSQAGISVKICISAVILDRLSGLAGLMTMFILTLPFLLNYLPYDTMLSSLVGIVLTSLVGALSVFILSKLPFKKIPFKWLEVIFDLSRQFLARLGTLYGFFAFIILSIFINILNCLIFYVISLGLFINVSLLDLLILLQPVFFLSMLPISISGWGVREGATVLALGFVGVSAEESLSISIVFGLALILISLPGGVIWLFSKKTNS
jgi:uncharacterized membrane protein YbhN (UPF0104 family)